MESVGRFVVDGGLCRGGPERPQPLLGLDISQDWLQATASSTWVRDHGMALPQSGADPGPQRPSGGCSLQAMPEVYGPQSCRDKGIHGGIVFVLGLQTSCRIRLAAVARAARVSSKKRPHMRHRRPTWSGSSHHRQKSQNGIFCSRFERSERGFAAIAAVFHVECFYKERLHSRPGVCFVKATRW